MALNLSIFYNLLLCRQAEKMRRQKEYANTIREQNKKINKAPITPIKEPEGKDKEVPRMKVRDLDHIDRLVVCIHLRTDA